MKLVQAGGSSVHCAGTMGTNMQNSEDAKTEYEEGTWNAPESGGVEERRVGYTPNAVDEIFTHVAFFAKDEQVTLQRLDESGRHL